MTSLNISYDIYFKFNLLELYKFIFVMLPIQILERKQNKKNWYSSASSWMPLIQIPNLILLYWVKSDISHQGPYIELQAMWAGLR